jgi:hypothetical protein
MASFMEWIDSLCMTLYGLVGVPVLDYLAGTFLLAMASVVVGEGSLLVAYGINRRHLVGLQREMTRMHNLSLDALRVKDKGAYKTFNREANEAHGKVFFNLVALSAASLWPAFFALAWMQTRFQGVGLSVPFVGLEVGYPAVFILNYILSKILFKQLRPHLPLFRRHQAMLKEDARSVGALKSLDEVFGPRAGQDSPG